MATSCLCVCLLPATCQLVVCIRWFSCSALWLGQQHLDSHTFYPIVACFRSCDNPIKTSYVILVICDTLLIPSHRSNIDFFKYFIEEIRKKINRKFVVEKAQFTWGIFENLT